MMVERVDMYLGITVYHNDEMLTSMVYVDDKKVREFHGESAWSNAERWANDVMLERLYA